MSSAFQSASLSHREPVRTLNLSGWQVSLLPSGPYETLYTPNYPIIGFSFDAQCGIHSFASDCRSSFRAYPNGVAFVPAGCEVFSESSEGGEYLKILCMGDTSEVSVIQHPFSNSIDKNSIVAAHRLRQIILKGDEFDLAECEHILLTLFSSVSEIWRNKLDSLQSSWLTNKRMQRVDDVIDALLDTKISVSRIASELGVSDAYFSRQFTNAIGRSPYTYITDKRIHLARELILKTNQDLSAIALAVGFSSHSHLTAQFRSVLGVTPRDIRAQK